jgi:thiol-disulfide isomerase/thioredoxin
MQRKIFFLCYWIFLFHNSSIFAQQRSGEKLPDLEFRNLINSKSTSIKLSDFRGKLIILDFWAFNCANCIEGFPKMDSLQKRFGNKIQILVVNHENQKKTNEFFEKRKKMFRRPDLLFITGDTILYKMFPKDYVPWEVWIDGERRFLFATDANEVTEERLASFLTERKFLGKKLTAHTDYNKRKPLFEQANKNYLDLIQFISYISKYEDNIDLFGSGLYQYKPGKARLVKGATNSIEELLIAAFGEDYKAYDFAWNNVSLEVSDTFKFRRPANGEKLDEWFANFSYNYDSILPDSLSTQAYEIMRKNLVSFFNVEVSIEKRKAKSLALIQIGKEDKLLSKGINQRLPMDNSYTRYNYPFTGFISDLKAIFRGFSIPFTLVDETNYTNNIDISGLDTGPLKEKNIMAFQNELRKYGLDLIEKEYVQDVLIIKDRKTKSNL